MNQSDTILKRAYLSCAQEGEQLTQPRKETLKTIACSDKPIGAYEILNQLQKVMPLPKPPTVYRAIDFWLRKGVIHRIDSLKAYVACRAEHQHQGSQFMVCDECGNVSEILPLELPAAINHYVENKRFLLTAWSIEIHGQCAYCQQVSVPRS